MIMSNNMSGKEFISLMSKVASEKGIKLSEKSSEVLLDVFSETLKRALCEYPTVNVDKVGYFAISRLSNRKRVLRNKEYWTKTFYKVRYYVPAEIQEALYNQYEGDLSAEDLE